MIKEINICCGETIVLLHIHKLLLFSTFVRLLTCDVFPFFRVVFIIFVRSINIFSVWNLASINKWIDVPVNRRTAALYQYLDALSSQDRIERTPTAVNFFRSASSTCKHFFSLKLVPVYCVYCVRVSVKKQWLHVLLAERKKGTAIRVR